MRSPIHEQAYDMQGLVWDYLEKVPMTEINLAKGLKNQARLETPLDEELDNSYALAMKAGAQFPAPLLHRYNNKGRYCPLDGNHTLFAKVKNEERFTDAYILFCEDEMIVNRVCWSVNNMVNGKRLTYEECLQHAISYARQYSVDGKVAAKEWGITAPTLYTHLRVLELREVIERNGVPTKKITNDVVDSLSALKAMGEDVLTKAASVAAENGLSSRDTAELVRAVKRAKSGPEKIETIDNFATSEQVIVRRAETKGGNVKPVTRPSVEMTKLLRKMEDLFFKNANTALRPQGGDYKTTKDTAGNVVEKLIYLFGLGVVPNSTDSAEVG